MKPLMQIKNMRLIFIISIFLIATPQAQAKILSRIQVTSPMWDYATTWHGSQFVNVKSPMFGAKGDGVTDDTAAIQAAINYNQPSTGDKNPRVVYIPPGNYLISDTIIIWNYTQFMGDETTPPTFILKSNSSGFNDPTVRKPVFVTAGGYSTFNWWDDNQVVGRLTQDIFLVEMQNFNMILQSGNTGATGILWKVAQACSLRNVNITAADAGIGIDVTGGEDYTPFYAPNQGGGSTIDNVSVTGGNTGIRIMLTSQMVLRGIKTQNQSNYGIDIQGIITWTICLVNVTTSNVPVGIHYTNSNELEILDSNLGGTTPFVTDGSKYYAENTLGLTNPNGAVFLGGGYSNGVLLGFDSKGTYITTPQSIPMKRTLPLAYRTRPKMTDIDGYMINVHDLGIVGDGTTDVTAALQSAINQYRSIFLPSGTYVVSDTLNLTSQTRIFGEGWARIQLKSNSQGFNDNKNPKPILLTPDDINNTASVQLVNILISSLQGNPGAIMIKWGSGSNSGIWDVFSDQGNYAVPISVGLNLYGHGGGVFSNIWAFQYSGVGGIGLLGTSTGPAWFYNVQFEHMSDTAYKISGASDYYFMNSEDEISQVAMNITQSKNIFIYGGIYSYYANQNTPPIDFIKYSDDSNLNLYGLFVDDLKSIDITMPLNGSSAVNVPLYGAIFVPNRNNYYEYTLLLFPTTYPILVSNSGTGLGMVYGSIPSNSNLINCGVNTGATACSPLVNAGTVVTLSAAAANGSIFGGWNITGSDPGTCAGTSSPCTLTVNTLTTVSTNFLASINGVCGTANKTYDYGTQSFGSDSLCAQGSPNPSTVVFPSAGSSVSWSCQGINNGANASCSASQASPLINTSRTGPKRLLFGPTIVTQPSSQFAMPPNSVSFTVTAIGSPAPSYQWEVSADSGKTFSKIAGETNATYTISSTDISMSGNQYRVLVISSLGVVTSDVATLTVAGPPVATKTLKTSLKSVGIGKKI